MTDFGIPFLLWEGANQQQKYMQSGSLRNAGGGCYARLKARPRAPSRKTEEAVDRRQNNESVKAVSPRH